MKPLPTHASDMLLTRRTSAAKGLCPSGIAAFLAVASPGAFAADLPIKARQLTMAAPALPVVSWTGWYVGVNTGWVNSGNELNTVATPVLGPNPGTSEGLAALSTGTVPVGRRSGIIGGGQIGYNWQFGTFVTGLGTDIQGVSGVHSTGAVTTAAVLPDGVRVISTQLGTVNTRFLGTVRGRLGFLATPILFVYGTGGLAYSGVSASTSLLQAGSNGDVGTGAGSLSDTRTGWTAGAGVEWIFAQNWSAKLEYLHYDVGTGSLVWRAIGPAGLPVYQTNVSSARFDGDLVRAGVNLHF